jgi:BlaI family transcriptional regulator, penicillinase repressor
MSTNTDSRLEMFTARLNRSALLSVLVDMPEHRRLRPFGELEAVIMDRLWTDGRPMLVRDVVDGLQLQRPLAYTTVMTVMDNLHRKGWLTRQRDGRAWRYEPAVSRGSYTAQLMNDVLATSTDRAGALTRFVEEIEPDDVAALADAVARAMDERRKAPGS